VLAVRYNASQLQNAILNCFRQYHAENVVNLHHLMWMISTTEDNTKLPMTAYLIQQIAYEIAEFGIEDYEMSNHYLPYFIREGNCFVRYELVKAIAWRATTAGREAGDPATSDRNSWLLIVTD
jgi:hypothetical protein